MSRPYILTMNRDGEFIKAWFECILCDAPTITDCPACAMISLCETCAAQKPTNESLKTIVRLGFASRVSAITKASMEEAKNP